MELQATVVISIKNLKDTGKEQYHKFRGNVIEDSKVSVDKPLKRNMLPLFNKGKQKIKIKEKDKVNALKSNCSLFGHRHIAVQPCDSNLKEFLRYAN